MLSQTSVTLTMAADPGDSPLYGLLPDARYAPLAGMVGELSNGRVDDMLWSFGEMRHVTSTDLSAFSHVSHGSLPM